MGSGKSKIAIELLKLFGGVDSRKSLIVCPAAVLGVWRGQFNRHAPDEFSPLVLDINGNAARKTELVHQQIQNMKAIGNGAQPLVVVVNYETLFREPMYSLLLSERWDYVVCDEIHKIKAHNTQSGKACWHIGKKSVRRLGLTGTLCPHSPLDVFGSYRFLDDTIFGRYITHFRNNFCVMNKFIPGKVDAWKNQEVMQERINSIRFHIDRQILTLPDKQDIVIECPLSAKGMKLYLEMKRDALILLREIMDSHPADTPEELERAISASNAAVKALRLLQLAQGYATAEDGEEVDTDTQKRRMLLELIEQTDEPICVYGYFKHDMKVVRDCCEILGKRFGEVSGSRKDLSPHGTYPDDVDVLSVQVKSGSSGIDLTRARIGIFLNTGTISPGDYDQVVARQHRPGQTRNVVFYHLITPKTVDEHIQKARAERRTVIHALLNEVFENEFEKVF